MLTYPKVTEKHLSKSALQYTLVFLSQRLKSELRHVTKRFARRMAIGRTIFCLVIFIQADASRCLVNINERILVLVKNINNIFTLTSLGIGHLSVFLISTLALTACGAGTPLATIDSATNSTTTPTSAESVTDEIQSGSTEESDSQSRPSSELDHAAPQIGSATPTSTDENIPTNPTTPNSTLDPNESVACNAPSADIQQRTLSLINEARSQPRNCGAEPFEATHALTWNTQLFEAANSHSVDMTRHNFFDHTGSDGSTISMRVDDTGYNWRAVGENIAAGQTSATQAVEGWLNSPGHCRNLMSPDFTHVAVACVEDDGADYTYYWTNVLAAPL